MTQHNDKLREAYLLGRADEAADIAKHLENHPPVLVGDLAQRAEEKEGNDNAHKVILTGLIERARKAFAARSRRLVGMQ